MLKFIKYLSLLFSFLSFKSTCAQSNKQHTVNYNIWTTYVGNHKIANKWSLHAELCPRISEVKNWQQILIRPGIIYNYNSNLSFVIGYAFIQNFPYGNFPVQSKFFENRIWQQAQLKTQIGKATLISRVRLEQRFNYLPTLSDNNTYKASKKATYTNRLRYLQRYNFPFYKSKNEVTKIYAFVADEIFLNFGKNVQLNKLDQNRLFVGIGKKINANNALELSYLNHTLFKPDGIKVERNQCILLQWNYSIRFLKIQKNNL